MSTEMKVFTDTAGYTYVFETLSCGFTPKGIVTTHKFNEISAAFAKECEEALSEENWGLLKGNVRDLLREVDKNTDAFHDLKIIMRVKKVSDFPGFFNEYALVSVTESGAAPLMKAENVEFKEFYGAGEVGYEKVHIYFSVYKVRKNELMKIRLLATGATPGTHFETKVFNHT